MSVKHRIGKAEAPKKSSLSFNYEVDDFQLHAFNAIEEGEHVLVTAHTGSGKTTVAEYAIAYGLQVGSKVIYTAPIKALSNQVFANLRKKYSWNLGIKTGDIDYNSEQAEVLIMTTEILHNMLYRNDDFLSNIKIIIFDEVHYIKDRDRGHIWERCIMLMPPDIQMVMLSATLPDADKFCQWIADCKGRNITHTTTPYRAVPLTHYIMTEYNLVEIMDKDNNFKYENYTNAMRNYDFKISSLYKYIPRIDLPALFFCFNKKQCQQYALQLTTNCVVVTSEEAMTIRKTMDSLLRKFKNYKELLAVSQTDEVFNLASSGICYHHAGLLPPLKEIVQELFSMGLIKVLFVTETFAAGVNMPAKTVVFTSFTKYDGLYRNFRVLLPEEYSQMSGRAGRRGMDTIGSVIHLPFDIRHQPDVVMIREMMCGNIRNIESRIKADYHHIFNSILYNTDILSKKSMRQRDNNAKLVLLKEEFELEKKNMKMREEALKFSFKGDLDSFNETYENYCKAKIRGKKNKYLKWYSDNKEMCQKLSEFHEDMAHLEKLKGDIEMLNDEMQTDINHACDFLTKLNYIDSTSTSSLTLTLTLTLKGVMASGINEANCLLLTELIMRDYLEDLKPCELASVLSIFLDAKNTDRELNLPQNIADKIKDISTLCDDMERLETIYASCYSNWEINYEFCDMAYWWTDTGCVSRVYNETQSDIQVGEFVRMMIKLNNICKEGAKAATICQRDNLFMKFNECSEKIMTGIVCPDSLYLI